MRKVKRVSKVFVLSIAGIAIVIFCVNLWVVLSTQDDIYYMTDKIPSRKVALLLGTSKWTSEGGSNKYFEERIEAAKNLYNSGIIQHIIVSGDNNTIYYNEPRDMFRALEESGVPKSAITLDFAGFRTLDSVIRSKEIFGQEDLLIITQDFHCYRALFIAKFYKINAIAYSADNKDELPISLAIREILARFRMILDLYIFRSDPKFLGEKEDLPIN